MSHPATFRRVATSIVKINADAELSVQKKARPVPCFAMGTHILTPTGDRLIQDLKVGDLVETLDHGAQPVRGLGARRVVADGAQTPIRFRAGTLNNEHDLCVMPGHRIRFAGWQSDLLFGEWEVLVAARDFVNGTDVTRDEVGAAKYFYLNFDAHHIIFAERVPVESAQLADVTCAMTFPPLEDHEAQVLLRSYPTKAKEPAKPTA